MLLTIVPQGGLCNRIRAVDASVGLARRVGLDLRIIWQSNGDCNCAFSRLMDLAYPASVTERTNDLPPFYGFLFRHGRLSSFATGVRFLDRSELVEWQSKPDFIDRFRGRNTTIKTVNSFFENGEPLQWLRPTREVDAKVEQTVRLFSR